MKRSAAALILLATGVIFFSSLGLAAWNIQDLDQPESHDLTSNQTETKQVVKLTDNNNNPVNETDLEDSGNTFSWMYNDTYVDGNSATGSMEHLAGGYWYADFEANYTNGSIEYELIPSAADSDEINVTEKLGLGNLTVEVQNNFSKQYKANKEIVVEANVTNAWTGKQEQGADVDIYFTNGTWTSGLVSLGYNSNKNLFTNTVELPPKTNASYVVHINTTYSSAGYKNANGSESLILKTYPAIKGKLAYLNTTGGCNNNSMFEACERDAEIDVGLNITASSANNVNMSVMVNNTTSGNWETRIEKRLTKSGDVFHGSFTVPELDTSVYEKNIFMRFNATNEDRNFVLTRNITYRSFTIRDKSSPTAYLGSSYKVKLLFGKYFSLTPLNASRFRNATVYVRYPDNSVLESFMMSSMDYKESSGVFEKSVSIPSDANNGTYEIGVDAFNTYGLKNTLESKFTVENIEASFNTSGDVSTTIDKTGIHRVNITITNQVNSGKTLSVDIGDSIKNITEVDEDNSVGLSAGETREVPIDLNITYVQDYSGEITFKDPDIEFSETIDLEVNSPTCVLRNDFLCIQGTDSWLNLTADERGYTTKTITLMFLGNKTGSVDIDTSITGEVSDYLTVKNTSFTLYDSRSIELNYSAQEPGNYSGEVEFTGGGKTLSFKTNLEATVEARETGLNVPSSLDLGYVPRSETMQKTVEITNSGTVAINGISASSEDYTVSMPETDLAEGETKQVDLTFDGVESESGTVTLEGTSSQGNVSGQISVTASPVDNYAEKTSELEQRVMDLSSQVTSSELQTQLQNVETMIPEIETAYQQGNYQEAKQKFEEAQSTLDSIETQVQSSQTDTGTQTGSGTDNTGQTQQGGGGGAIIALIASLVVILLIGFVAYTSIIPEEGDPLYNVLGK